MNKEKCEVIWQEVLEGILHKENLGNPIILQNRKCWETEFNML